MRIRDIDNKHWEYPPSVMEQTYEPAFYAALAKLNEDFVELLNKCHKEDTYNDYSQTCKDYMEFVKNLERDHAKGIGAANKLDNTMNRPDDNGFSLPSLPPQSNNSSHNIIDFNNTVNNNAAASNADGDAEGDDDDEPLPMEPQTERYHEPDSIHSVKCKMYCKNNSSYTLKGIGTLFIKRTAKNNHQVVIRAEPDLRKVLLNVLVSPSLPFRRQQKTIQLVCPDNPDTKETLTIALKFKSEADAITLIEKLEMAKSSA